MFRKLGGICFLLVLESVVMLVPSFFKRVFCQADVI